jgi:3',5'-cyclic AMP phosphodiesterase CpdA
MMLGGQVIRSGQLLRRKIVVSYNILVFSDLHLTRPFITGQKNWEVCLSVVADKKPDLVVITGDRMFDDPDSLQDHEYAHEQISRIPAPYLVLPGNHDVGDGRWDDPSGAGCTEARSDQFLKRHGLDRWSTDLGQWRLIGINSSLFDSGLEAENQQREWLEREITASSGRPLLLFKHKPICLLSVDESDATNDVMRPSSRRDLLSLLGRGDFRAVVTGHLHCPRSFEAGGLRMLWAPSTGMITDRIMAGHQRATGWLSLTLDDGHVNYVHDGAAALRVADFTPLLAEYGELRSIPHRHLQDI